jgi:4-diphosphocytidyl-2-C-methyl-D-erythritol kinase
MYKVRITAPAKVNLGLEILGRRDDGYHEIATVMAMVDLCDVIELTPCSGNEIKRAKIIRGIRKDEDLTVRALYTVMMHKGHYWENATIGLEKHIPIAAGLGGASSDAAAALLAANHYWERHIDQEQLHRDAASLGSDVPFFLGDPCALATGTGTTLEPLPAPRGWLVIVTPPFELAEKTTSMFAALQPSDYSDGARVARVARTLRAGQLPRADDLHNAFARPLYELAPDLAKIPSIMCLHTAKFAALSGAGPSHYTWFRNAAGARSAVGQMASSLPEKTRVYVAPFSSVRLEDRLTVSLT